MIALLPAVLSKSDGWPSQTRPPKVFVVAAAVADTAVAGLADIAATIPMSHLCGVKQFCHFFLFFYVSIFFQV